MSESPILSAEQVQELRELHEQATPGQWKAEDIGARTMAFGIVSETGLSVVEYDFIAPRNAQFIAAIKNAAPALIEELIQLRAENALLKRSLTLLAEQTKDEA